MKHHFLPALFLILNSAFLIAQDDSLLLEKIKNIEVSLTFLPDEENLYSPEVSFQSFYEELSPYGEWIMMTKEEIEKALKDGEGQAFSADFDLFQENADNPVFLWRPSIASRDWHPYLNGRWEYTDQGWMWVSNYDWGWAPYHYGRWLRSKHYGWLWMPGYVWAPSWVVWRVSDNHIGWSPLSPSAIWKSDVGITPENYKTGGRSYDWVFIQKSKFADPILESNIVPKTENKSIISKSVPIVGIKSDNGKVVSSGPDVTEVEKFVGRKIEQKSIKPTNEKRVALVGQKNIQVYQEKFKKRDLRSKKFDRPKKFKKSPKAKKLLRRIRLHRHR